MLIDVNASYGPWPFAPLGCETLAELDRHLAAHRIEAALVSPLRAVFYPDPHPANQSMLREAPDFPRLLPIPTLNPELPNCLRCLESYLDQAPLRGVKLYPNFHHYSLASRRVSELCQTLQQLKLPLLINFRLEDERHHYRGLKLRRVSLSQTIALARRFPELPLLCLGLYRDELAELAPHVPQLHADLSFADWHRLIPLLLEQLQPHQLLFGSHTPFMVTEANAYKLASAPVEDSLKAQIGALNAQTLFKL